MNNYNVKTLYRTPKSRRSKAVESSSTQAISVVASQVSKETENSTPNKSQPLSLSLSQIAELIGTGFLRVVEGTGVPARWSIVELNAQTILGVGKTITGVLKYNAATNTFTIDSNNGLPAGLISIQNCSGNIQLTSGYLHKTTVDTWELVNNLITNSDYASQSTSGIVSTGSQSFAGPKTFLNGAYKGSDRRLKRRIRDIKCAEETIRSIAFIGFERKSGGKSFGVIAQDVEKIVPDLVHENGSLKSVDYDGIFSIACKALQGALWRIEELEKSIKELSKKDG
jgi:hypothetical protein